jgi:hypothetical protein
MKDLASDVGVSIATLSAIRTTSPTAVEIDRKGFESLLFAFQTGVGGITFDGSNRIDWTMEHSDVSGSGYTAVGADDIVLQRGETLITGGIVRRHAAAHAAASIKKVGYIGEKQFIRLTPVFVGTHGTGTQVAAFAILGSPNSGPVA